MSRRKVKGLHFIQGYAAAAAGSLPGSFTPGKTGTNDVDYW
jgi:hypothetical protein